MELATCTLDIAAKLIPGKIMKFQLRRAEGAMYNGVMDILPGRLEGGRCVCLGGCRRGPRHRSTEDKRT